MTTTESKRSDRIRLGIIGCTPAMSDGYEDAIGSAANVQLQAIADQSQARLADMCTRLRPSRVHRDKSELLADPQVDLVLVAGEHGFDAALIEEALTAGKHVLVNRFCGIPVDDGERLRPLASGKVLAFGSHRRFLPGVRATRRFLNEEGGDVSSFASTYFDRHYRHVSGVRHRGPDGKTADKRLQGWLTHGPQVLDMARHLLGPISAIRLQPSETTDRVGCVELRFASGARGQCSQAFSRTGTFDEGFELRCAGGKVTCGYPHFWFHREYTRIYSASRKLHWSPDARDCHTFRLQLEALAQTILTGARQVSADLDDAIACGKALGAGSHSLLHGGKWVEVEAAVSEIEKSSSPDRELAVA